MDNTKSAKSELYIRQTINAVIVAGIIILLIGIYYCAVKAGIPYQDPPLELQIQYAINMGIGDILVKNGLLTAGIGGISRLIIGMSGKCRKFIGP